MGAPVRGVTEREALEQGAAMPVQEAAVQEKPVQGIPVQGAVPLTDAQYAQRLAGMLQCRTVSRPDSYDDTEFAKLRGVMRELFPLVHTHCERMAFGADCWVYRLAGRDEARNVMLMSHHDVVAAGDG